jgi:hypothetical protein
VPTRSGIANNCESLPAHKDYKDKFNIKLDYQFSGKLSTFVRISHCKMNNFEPPTIPGASGGDANAYVGVLNQQLAAGVTYRLSMQFPIADLIPFNREGQVGGRFSSPPF